MTKYQNLYNELRPFVSHENLKDYDTEFFKRKRPSFRFMIPYLYEFVGKKIIRKKLKDPELIEFFNILENKFHVDSSKLVKAVKKAKQTPRHFERNFLIKNINKDNF